MVCWFMWLERNKKPFENMTPSTSTIAYKALGMHKIWTTIHPRKETTKKKAKMPFPEEIPTGWFDGATWSIGQQSGARGLISILSNSQCRWTSNYGLGTNTGAELLGAWATLHLASRLNIDILQLYGDSRIVTD
jgi:hypothetical protein